MTKLRIFIDFEAISLPFTRKTKIESNFPFAYTLGFYVGKKFKTRTFIFNFQKEALDSINEIMRKQIIHDIRFILDQKNFAFNKDSVEFIGWNPTLEKQILGRIFPNFIVNSLSKGIELSLTRLTHEIKNDYFSYFKKIISQQINSKLIQRRGMNHDGAIAAFAGYLLYAIVHDPKNKLVVDFNLEILLKEIRRYSREDVTRMHFLHSHPELFAKRREKALLLIKQKNKLKNMINQKERLLKLINKFKSEKTVAQISQEIHQEILKLVSKKEEAEKDFENI